MKKIMIAFAWTVCVLTACDKNKPSQTEMQALPVDVAKPLVENVTLTKDYPGSLYDMQFNQQQLSLRWNRNFSRRFNR